MYGPKTRACGKRLAAGVYAETRLSPFGEPGETFILCPLSKTYSNLSMTV